MQKIKFRADGVVVPAISSWARAMIRRVSRSSSTSISTTHIQAKHEHLVLPPTPAGIEFASSLLKAGRLVAFPTETVYGLGANALNAQAVEQVFAVKERPLTDPLIVHVLNSTAARHLINATEMELSLFNALGKHFWPGPLTLIVQAAPAVPSIITANTGKVGIRVPAHPVARALLEASQLPIAAPSANLFGHVSPTRCAHVLSDLGAKHVHVLHGEYEGGGSSGSDLSVSSSLADVLSSTSCEHGIESTVLKIDGAARRVLLLRHGTIGTRQIQTVLDEVRNNDSSAAWKLQVGSTQRVGIAPAAPQGAVASPGEEAPGQSVTHYAPALPCYVVLSSSNGGSSTSKFAGEAAESPLRLLREDLAHTVVLDFGGILASHRDAALAYRDLSADGSYVEAAACVFDSLRWAELQHTARMVILPDLNLQNLSCADSVAIASGLHDRLYRAASGRSIVV